MPATPQTAPAWTNRIWNPVSPDLGVDEERLGQPFRWKKAARIRVNATADLFHPRVDDQALTRVFEVMEAGLNRRHTFQILTRHPQRMRAFMLARQKAKQEYAAKFDHCPTEAMRNSPAAQDARARAERPPANLWLGVPVENQRAADVLVPDLLQTPAAVRFVHCAPLLGPLDLGRWLRPVPGCGYVEPEDGTCGHPKAFTPECHRLADCPARRRPNDWHGLDWVIAGGESGPRARPLHPAWARQLRDLCDIAGVPFFFTQHGEYTVAVVEDDPEFSGGRAYDNPLGGRSAASLLERGPNGTFRGGQTRPMRPGDRTSRTVMLDADTIAVRVGRAAAGRMLDGQAHDAFPEPSHGR